MTTKYASFIKKLRKEREFSQQEVASKIGVSRPSFIAIEKGTRELNLPEAEKLAALFGITIDELLETTLPNYNKYKQMILAYLKSGVSSDGKVPKTKLAKLLYLADFAWYYKHFTSMSGMPYRKLTYGPVPDTYFRAIDELFESGEIDIKNTTDGAMLISATSNGKKLKLDLIDTEENALIGDITARWKNRKTQDIVAFTHKQLPYKICSEDEIIPYELITQEDPENVY